MSFKKSSTQRRGFLCSFLCGVGMCLLCLMGCTNHIEAGDTPDARLIAALKAGDAKRARQALNDGANPNAKEGTSHERLNPIDTSA